MSAWRYGAYLTTSEKGCEGLGRPSKINLNSLFSFAKKGVEWLRTHRVRFDKCLQLVSSSPACAEKASLALSPPALVLQPPLQGHCWCCWERSSHKYQCRERRGAGTTGPGTSGRGGSRLCDTLGLCHFKQLVKLHCRALAQQDAQICAWLEAHRLLVKRYWGIRFIFKHIIKSFLNWDNFLLSISLPIQHNFIFSLPANMHFISLCTLPASPQLAGWHIFIFLGRVCM